MTWTEPTRRLTFSPRFTYEGRYGASLVALVLGGYLLLNTNLAPLVIALAGRGSLLPEEVAFFLLQTMFAVAVIVFALAVAPASSGRRVIAVVVVLVLIVVWAIVYTARFTGAAGPFPMASGFVASPAFIVPLATVTGWLIVRERPGISYLALLISLIGGAIPFLLVLNAVPLIFGQLVHAPLAAVLGVSMAWIARVIAGAYGNIRANDEYVDPPPPSS